MKLRTAVLSLAVSMAFAGAATAAGNASPAGDSAPPPAPMMSKDAIVASLKGAGYTKVHEVELEDGVWEADAVDTSGHKVKLKLDPYDGHVLVPGQARAGKEASEDAGEHAEDANKAAAEQAEDANEHAEDANEQSKDAAEEAKESAEHPANSEEHH